LRILRFKKGVIFEACKLKSRFNRHKEVYKCFPSGENRECYAIEFEFVEDAVDFLKANPKYGIRMKSAMTSPSIIYCKINVINSRGKLVFKSRDR